MSQLTSAMSDLDSVICLSSRFLEGDDLSAIPSDVISITPTLLGRMRNKACLIQQLL